MCWHTPTHYVLFHHNIMCNPFFVTPQMPIYIKKGTSCKSHACCLRRCLKGKWKTFVPLYCIFTVTVYGQCNYLPSKPLTLVQITTIGSIFLAPLYTEGLVQAKCTKTSVVMSCAHTQCTMAVYIHFPCLKNSDYPILATVILHSIV